MKPSNIIDAAIFAQAHLDEALPLARLAAIGGSSPHHFHRLFTQATGETPATFVQRLRLEKAAFRLLLHDDQIISIALDCGYTNHETLSRAFRRQFGCSPRDYRRQQRLNIISRRATARQETATSAYQLSSTRIVQLQPLPIAYIRSTGPYEQVDTDLWVRLNQWADQNDLPRQRMLIGIGHDAVSVTKPEQLRFDACITVPIDSKGSDKIRIGKLPALMCAVTTHVGGYSTLPAAYPEIFGRAISQPGYKIIGLPAIEIYRDTSVDNLRAVSTTDIYLPVQQSTATDPLMMSIKTDSNGT